MAQGSKSLVNANKGRPWPRIPSEDGGKTPQDSSVDEKLVLGDVYERVCMRENKSCGCMEKCVH